MPDDRRLVEAAAVERAAADGDRVIFGHEA
jgi:hypothetical protein